MHRTTPSRVARSLLLTAVVASSVFVAGEALADTASMCGVITYCGGPVISNVQVVPVYWTSNVSTTITGWAPDYLSALTGSELMDMLSEYSTAGRLGEACGMQTDAGLQYFGPSTAFSTYQSIGRGTATQAYTITPTQATGSNIADDSAAIGAELVSQIQAGHLPAPTYDAQGYPNTLYMVFFPQNVSITLQGMGSCSAFGGYHYSATYNGQANCKGQYIPYAVIPDCGGGDLSGVCSHELAEAVTDTDVGPTVPMSANYGDGAWYLGPTYPCSDPTGASCPHTCGEVGDVCEYGGNTTATVPGTQIISQNIWSQQQNGCKVYNPSVGAKPAVPGTNHCGAPTPPPTDAGGSSSGSASSSGSGSSSGGSGSGSGSSSGSSSGSGTSSGGDLDAGSSGGPVTTRVDSGAGMDGGNFDAGGTNNSGCSCTTVPANASGGAGTFGALLGLALLARSKSRPRR